ncbi:c-type cytochrome [Flavobacterium sp.]|uniref:c-type cytochrome n=1 Tax=Flavobacterium sp. TaxID=239 RepID=UPI0037507DB6
MKSIFKISFVLALILSLSSCKDSNSPNYQYMPNMYESVAYETYSESNAFNSINAKSENGKEGQLPPVGTIKRGYVPYEYANTPESYVAVKAANLKSPIDPTKADMKKAQELFEIYCAICHGNAGDGKGKLVTQGKFLGVPSYADRIINEGSINHVINFGLNSMGSYANQLNQDERWLVAAYVMKLKSEL